jgi:hypothetical protein
MKKLRMQPRPIRRPRPDPARPFAPPRSARVLRLIALLATPPDDPAGVYLLRRWLLRCRAADFGIVEVRP